MKLKKMILKNYRSIGEDEQIIDFENLTMLIGNNSVGKTAALSGLKKLFSEVPNERVLKRSDFHLPKGIQPENFKKQELVIEAIFEFDELLDDQVESSPAIPIFFESFIVEGPDSLPKLRVRLEASWEDGSTVDGTIESNIYFITCPETSEVTADNKKNASRHDLNKIRLIYVPAVRDPGKQLKNVSGSMIHQVMNSINWKDETRENVKEHIDKINEDFSVESGVSILKNAIQKEWYEYQSDTRYTKADLKFNATTIDAAVKNTEVLFSPTETGREYSIDEMGDGMKSLFYMSIVDSILDVEVKMNEEMVNGEDLSFTKESPVLTIVAVEEPENHISPQILGKLVNKLRDISKKGNAQTIITSHSPAIVKRMNPEEIRHFRMDYDTLSTSIEKLTLPDNETNSDQYKYVKEAVKAYPEIYFAKLVIFGEGDSEEILLPKFFEADGSGLDSSGVSIVPLGGRHVSHFWRLVADLGIPHITLLDLDREREGGGWGRIEYVIKQLLQIGINREELLKLEDGNLLDDDRLDEMHSWKVTCSMNSIIARLENHNVYFSSPLDIDFMMLESFGQDYISTISDREGPRIKLSDTNKKVVDLNDSEKKLYEFKERISHDIGKTLKNNDATGITYSETQKELMIWYNYFFLNRGKPSTHIAVLSQISDAKLIKQSPEVLKRMIFAAKKIFRSMVIIMSNTIASTEWIPADGLTLESNAIEAVKSERNILVVAGPGAGKTELLAQKAGYLFSTNICPTPKKILAISFKKDSAENLKERIEKRYGKKYGRRFTSLTYDAFAKRMLDQFFMALTEGNRPSAEYSIGDKAEIRKAFFECGFQNDENMREYDLDKLFDANLASVTLPIQNSNLTERVWNKLLNGSENISPSLTFKMISLLTTYIFQSNGFLKNSLRETYSHVFLDEFQDTTDIQYNLVRTCFQTSGSIITAVGDNKQRIMVWAGARQTVFEDFQKDFSASRIQLVMNHRSAPRLVELQKMMYEVLSENVVNIETSASWEQDAGEIELLLTNNDDKEAEYIASDIFRKIQNGMKPRDICILVKQTPNKYVSKIIEKLKDIEVRARIEIEYQDLLKESITNLLISFIKLSINRQSPDEREYVMDTIINLKGIGESTFETRYNTEQRNLSSTLDEICERLKSVDSRVDLNNIFSNILSYFDVQKLKTMNPTYTQGSYFDRLVEHVEELLWNEYEQVSNWEKAIENFVRENSVSIMTIHKSKGLEYQAIYFVGLEDGAFWNFRKRPEEDRRAFFVAISRAKEFLTFSFCKYRSSTRISYQSHNNINEFFELLQQPGNAKVIDLTN